jgi:hypothetical protein
VAEWFKAAVLKTANPQGFVGSNPTPSARCRNKTLIYQEIPDGGSYTPMPTPIATFIGWIAAKRCPRGQDTTQRRYVMARTSASPGQRLPAATANCQSLARRKCDPPTFRRVRQPMGPVAFADGSRRVRGDERFRNFASLLSALRAVSGTADAVRHALALDRDAAAERLQLRR